VLRNFKAVVENAANLTKGSIVPETDVDAAVQTGTSYATDTKSTLIMMTDEVALKADTAKKLATYNFTVGTGAKFEEELAVTLTEASFMLDADIQARTATISTAATEKGVEIETTYQIQWIPAGGTITGESENTTKTETLNYKAAVTAPAVERTGYDFQGWTPTVVSAATADATYTATWKAQTHNVIWDYNYDVTPKTSSVPYTTDTVIAKLQDPVRTGYQFDGWFDGAGAAANQITFTDAAPVMGAQDVNYFAHWTANTYHVYFKDAQGGVLKDYSYTYGLAAIPASDVPAVPAKDGYTAVWTAFDLTLGKDQDVTPAYTAIDYTITYILDGGTNGASPVTAYTVESTGTLPTPTKTGYRFLGWKATTAAGSWTVNTTYDAGTSLTGSFGNVTLTARWELTATVIFENYFFAEDGQMLMLVYFHGADMTENQYTYDGNPMYYINDESYKVDGHQGVFAYIIDAKETATAAAKLAVSAKEGNGNKTIVYSGNINGQGGVDEADVTVTYNLYTNRGLYGSRIDMEHRLMADMSRTPVDGRASMADVDAVIAAAGLNR